METMIKGTIGTTKGSTPSFLDNQKPAEEHVHYVGTLQVSLASTILGYRKNSSLGKAS